MVFYHSNRKVNNTVLNHGIPVEYDINVLHNTDTWVKREGQA